MRGWRWLNRERASVSTVVLGNARRLCISKLPMYYHFINHKPQMWLSMKLPSANIVKRFSSVWGRKADVWNHVAKCQVQQQGCSVNHQVPAWEEILLCRNLDSIKGHRSWFWQLSQAISYARWCCANEHGTKAYYPSILHRNISYTFVVVQVTICWCYIVEASSVGKGESDIACKSAYCVNHASFFQKLERLAWSYSPKRAWYFYESRLWVAPEQFSENLPDIVHETAWIPENCGSLSPACESRWVAISFCSQNGLMLPPKQAEFLWIIVPPFQIWYSLKIIHTLLSFFQILPP